MEWRAHGPAARDAGPSCFGSWNGHFRKDTTRRCVRAICRVPWRAVKEGANRSRKKSEIQR